MTTSSQSSSSRQHDNSKRLKKLKRVIFLRKRQAKSEVLSTNGTIAQTRNNSRRSCPLLERSEGNRYLFCGFNIDEVPNKETSITACSFAENNDTIGENRNDDKEKKTKKGFYTNEKDKSLSPLLKQNGPPFESDSFHDTSFGVRKRRGKRDNNPGSDVTKQCSNENMTNYQTVKLKHKYDQASPIQLEEKSIEQMETNGKVPRLTVTVLSASTAPSEVALESAIVDGVPLDSAIGPMRIIQDIENDNDNNDDTRNRQVDVIKTESMGEEENYFQTATQRDTAARQTTVGAFRVPGINSQESTLSRSGTIVYQMGDDVSSIENEHDSSSNNGFLIEAQIVDLESEKEELKERILSELSSKIKDEMLSAREEERKLAHSRLVAKKTIARWKSRNTEKCKARKINHRFERKFFGLMVTASLVAFLTWLVLE